MGQALHHYFLRKEEKQLQNYYLGHYEETTDVNNLPLTYYFAVQLPSQSNKSEEKSTIDSQEDEGKIVVLVRSNFGDCSLKICEFFKKLTNENIYFQRKQYEKGFQNILSALDQILSTCEIFSSASNLTNHEKKLEITINSVLFINQQIFLSEVQASNEFIQSMPNRWWVKTIKGNEYFELSEEKDFIDISTNYSEVQRDITLQLSEIILSDSLNDKEKTCADLNATYPLQSRLNSKGLYCLKVIMKQENQGNKC